MYIHIYIYIHIHIHMPITKHKVLNFTIFTRHNVRESMFIYIYIHIYVCICIFVPLQSKASNS